MAVFSASTRLSILKAVYLGCCLGLCSQTDKQVHNNCIYICKTGAGPESVAFSLFSELPHIMENDLLDYMHCGGIAIVDFNLEFMILPVFSFFFLIYLPLCYCAELLLDAADKCSGAELGNALAKEPCAVSRHFCQKRRK